MLQPRKSLWDTHPFATLIGTGILVFIALGIAMQKIGSYTPIHESGVSDDGETKIGCVCAKSLEDVYSVVSAYRDSDPYALQGLIVHGKALNLEQGVKVHRIFEEHGITSVSIRSGFQSGETCEMESRFIQWDNGKPK